VGGRAHASWLIGPAGFVVCCAAGGWLLPNGLPVGIILFGLLLGSLTALTAMGLVILYRSARIINFAQAEIGGLSAAVAVILVTGAHLPYLVAVPIGLVAALVTGALIDLVVMRWIFQSPRLIVTVATIALAQLIGAAELGLPGAFAHLKPLTTFTTPFTASRRIGPMVFNGNEFLAMLVVPVVLLGLAWFFGRTTIGVAIRGAADSTDRATLLGIPVRRLSTVTWVIAAGLSGVAALLTAPILGPQIGLLGGPESLLPPLAAAVVARMESLPTAFFASLAIGVFQQAVFWSYPRASTVDVALFVLVLGSLVLQRRRVARVDDSGLGGYVAVREVRPIPDVLRRLPEVRWGRAAIAALVVVGVFGLPLVVSPSKQTLLAYLAIYGILAVSMVILTGWSGQVSLGQFAFAGVGAGTTAALFVDLHADLFLCLGAAAVVGAVAAVLIGIPAIRLPGLFLAVATLAFSVPVSTFLLNSSYFPKFTPAQLMRPAVFQRIGLDSALSFYFFCLVFLIAALVLARNYRRTRAGRVAMAVRDNARGAAAFAVSPLRVRLSVFAFAGALAGVAGGLYVIGLRGVPFSGFSPELSLDVFIMVVIGGVGTLTGGLLGAAYLQGVQYFLRGAWQLLATGGGLLIVVIVFPGGLADLFYRARDAALGWVAARHDLSVPSLAERAAFEPNPPHAEAAATTAGLLSLRGVDAAYGSVPVLFGVDLEIADGEIVGLLGTNGAGKSTALRVVSGLLKARQGTVTFDGRDVTGLSPVDRVRAGIVMVPSGRGVFPSLTVADNLRLGAWLARRDRPFVEATTARIFELFPPLELRLGTAAGLLSGGEQQMLTIAQALYCRPRLLMIDELSLGLAPIVVAELLDVVRGLAAEGVTVVIVEQSLSLATSVAQRSVFMERGQVRFSGPTAELAARPDLVRSVFFGGAGDVTRRRALRARTGPAAFAVQDVSRHFGGVAALDRVSLEVGEGEILGIIGANGAGKTTLFDICSGFLAPSAGRLFLGEVDVTDAPAYERADLGLGRVFQDARLFPSLTVSEAIAVALERHIEVRDPILSALHTGPVADSEAEVRRRVAVLIERFGLERYRDAFVSELSTGTRRVVELAGVVAHDPRVLLLDEPTSGIAQRESEALGRLLLDLRAQTGSAFIVIEHDVPLVASIADRLVCLHLGEVIAEGRPRAVLADPAVVAAYLGDDSAAIERSGGAGRPRRLQSATRRA
jgi:ABC-type branched-subunit amino acid transport system ATPase component/ABC-type branched-subunit amino acid transport system permease subunit